LGNEFELVKTTAEDKSITGKAVTGRFPLLEVGNKEFLGDSITICKHLARQHASFYGKSAIETSQIEQWIDYVNSSVSPLAKKVRDQLTGRVVSD